MGSRGSGLVTGLPNAALECHLRSVVAAYGEEESDRRGGPALAERDVLHASALGVLLGGTEHFSGHGDARKCAGAGRAKGMARDAQRAANSPVSTRMRGHSQQRANGLEPSTFSLEG